MIEYRESYFGLDCLTELVDVFGVSIVEPHNIHCAVSEVDFTRFAALSDDVSIHKS